MKTNEIKTVHVTGDIGLSPVIVNMSSGYDMLARLIPTEFSGGHWGEYYFVHYLNIPNIQGTPDDYKESTYPIIKDTMLYTISGDDRNIVICLK